MRIVLASLAVFVIVLCMAAAGYLYINRVAAGMAREPVMFKPVSVTVPPQTPAALR